MHNDSMRTTISLSEEAHDFARYYAQARGLTLGAAIDELIRKAEAAPPPPTPAIEYGPNNFPMFPRSERVITSAMVKRLEAEFDPKAST